MKRSVLHSDKEPLLPRITLLLIFGLYSAQLVLFLSFPSLGTSLSSQIHTLGPQLQATLDFQFLHRCP